MVSTESERFQQSHVIFKGSLSLYRTQREVVLRVLQCTVYNTKVDTTCVGKPGRTNRAYRCRSTEARWPITVRVSIGRFEQLLQLVVIKRRDARALLGSIFLDIFTVSGPIFLKPTLLPLVL